MKACVEEYFVYMLSKYEAGHLAGGHTKPFSSLSEFMHVTCLEKEGASLNTLQRLKLGSVIVIFNMHVNKTMSLCFVQEEVFLPEMSITATTTIATRCTGEGIC